MKTLAVLLVAGALVGCHDRAPTSPSAPPTGTVPPGTAAPPTPGSPRTLSLAGQLVDDSRVPVAGAQVKVATSFCYTTCCQCGSATSTVQTDSLGRYDATLELPPAINSVRALEVSIDKAGFERTHHYVDMTGNETVRNLRVRPLTTISAGEPALIAIDIDAEDSLCGFELEYACRMFRVRSAIPGNVSVDLAGDSRNRATLLTGDRFLPYGRTAFSLSLLVSDFSTPEFFVLVDWQSVRPTPQRIMLTTAVQSSR